MTIIEIIKRLRESSGGVVTEYGRFNKEVADLLEAMQSKHEPISNEQCRAKFEEWYSSAPDAEPEPERTYELTDESMSELTKECIWMGWQAAHGIMKGQQ
jgi:hypothetical protein